MKKKEVDGRAWEDRSVAGELASFSSGAGRRRRMLDGFHVKGAGPLVVFVHGMGSNFYRSGLKKAFLAGGAARGEGVLSFDNRGAGRGTEGERFRECLDDIDGALRWARRRGYREAVLVGHSTGCQKITYWQAMRGGRGGRDRAAVRGLVLLAPADDNAILRRDLGRAFAGRVAWAKRQVAEGRREAQVPGLYERFEAARFLSVADERNPEANVFRYAGRLEKFRKVKIPVLAVFGSEEEFAAIPPSEMLGILAEKTKSARFLGWEVEGAGHGFHGFEEDVAEGTFRWIATQGRGAGRRKAGK